MAAAAIPSPADESRLLMAEVLGASRAWVIAHPEALVPPDRRLLFLNYVARRCAHEPEAYLVGQREFYGLDFEVGPSVLIPRPETELLVDHALEASDRLLAAKGRDLQAVDLGTGSGAVAVVLAMRQPRLKVIAVDRSADALKVAATNAALHGMAGRIEFRQGDLLQQVDQRIDLLVANLPYIPSAEIDRLMPDVRDYEPHEALDGGEDGTDLIRRALQEAVGKMEPPATLLFEIGDGQGRRLSEAAAKLYPTASVQVFRDYAGFERILSVEMG
jgi:release factor glutamine methyltransferase